MDSKVMKPRTREASTSIVLDPNVRAMRVYPVEGSSKTVEDLQTIGIKVSREQAIHLARLLLAASQDWDEVDITANRLKARRDGTFAVTVTRHIPGSKSQRRS